MRGEDGESVILKWFPSEYLFRAKSNEYCLAADADSSGRKEILIGSTMMR